MLLNQKGINTDRTVNTSNMFRSDCSPADHQSPRPIKQRRGSTQHNTEGPQTSPEINISSETTLPATELESSFYVTRDDVLESPGQIPSIYSISSKKYSN